jgi:hypothetical protein
MATPDAQGCELLDQFPIEEVIAPTTQRGQVVPSPKGA